MQALQKMRLCQAMADHPMRRRFVATHPMWGTEYSGPEAAVKNAFVPEEPALSARKKKVMQLQWPW